MDYRTIISAIVVGLVFIAYLPYFRDIFKRKTVPHTLTWLVWTIAVGVSCALQVAGGAGVGAWMTATLTLVCLSIFVLSFWYGTKNITTSDVVFFVFALFSLALWVVAKQPILSVVLIVATDILGLVPTVRKSWQEPYSETLSMYEITAFRHALSILALEHLNILTTLYPVAWVIANAAFSLMLVYRRRKSLLV